MTATTETTPTERAYALIDDTLADIRGLNIVEAGKITDLLLDIRLLIAEITNGESS